MFGISFESFALRQLIWEVMLLEKIDNKDQIFAYGVSHIGIVGSVPTVDLVVGAGSFNDNVGAFLRFFAEDLFQSLIFAVTPDKMP